MKYLALMALLLILSGLPVIAQENSLCDVECAILLDEEIYYVYDAESYALLLLYQGGVVLKEMCMPEEDLPEIGWVATEYLEFPANVGINNWLACNRGV